MNEPKYICEKARSLKLGECYLNPKWKNAGMATILVTRIHNSGNYTIGLFLVDTFALGVKKSFFRFNLSPVEFEEFMFTLNNRAEKDMGNKVEKTEYSLIHNIIYGALAFAEEHGYKPCKEFAITQYILEEDTEDIEFIELEFGKDGKPLLIY